MKMRGQIDRQAGESRREHNERLAGYVHKAMKAFREATGNPTNPNELFRCLKIWCRKNAFGIEPDIEMLMREAATEIGVFNVDVRAEKLAKGMCWTASINHIGLPIIKVDKAVKPVPAIKKAILNLHERS